MSSLFEDFSIFFGQLIKNPKTVSAVVPSSKELARSMARAVPEGAGPVFEFGPGTGKITAALIECGILPRLLHAIELNHEFAALVADKFPSIHIHEMPAQDIGALGLAPARAVVSSLPLLSIPQDIQRDILSAAFKALAPGAPFIQFTYGSAPPVAPALLSELGLTSRPICKIWRNLPPAQIYILSQTAH